MQLEVTQRINIRTGIRIFDFWSAWHFAVLTAAGGIPLGNQRVCSWKAEALKIVFTWARRLARSESDDSKSFKRTKIPTPNKRIIRGMVIEVIISINLRCFSAISLSLINLDRTSSICLKLKIAIFNLRLGYAEIDIRSPREFINYED